EMLKKKDSPLKSSGKISKNQASSLALLISQMQQNADQVEKDILRSEELLAVDAENEKKELPFQHQEEISDKLGEAEGLLKDLFLDVDKAKKLGHPQSSEIESDVIHLHHRWLQDCTFYREVYDQIDDVSVMPRIEWAPVFSTKQVKVNSDEFGPTMADLEKQIAAHNILHKEIEAYSPQLCVSSAGSKENSKWRRHYLNSLYEYTQACKKELSFLADQQDKIKKQDWSDRIVDPFNTRRQYENFKNNNLLSHEGEVNRLQEEGDRLIDMKHPASATIEAQKDSVRNEWQKFLNLCICQETHLDNVEEFKRYQLETEQLSETLTKLNNSLDPKSASKKNNSEMLLQLETEETAVQNCEQQLSDLRRRSTSIAPLRQRRTNLNRPVTVESLCDWDTDKGSVSRGEKFTLKSNADTENWDIIAPDGSTKTFPGVCFQIPPPDPEAIHNVDLLGNELADIKNRRAVLETSLKNHKLEVSRPQKSAVAQQLDKLDNDLVSAEESLLSQLRAPLSRTDPAGDLANRLREQEKTAKTLKALEQQKQAAQADLQPLLSEEVTSSALPLKLSAANNKHDSIGALADLYAKKANASLNLEKQIKNVDGLVSGFEKKLSEDASFAHPSKNLPLPLRRCAAQGDMKKLSQDLETSEQLCHSLQQGYQEFCPDIQRQRTKVKQLQNRHANVGNQLNEREKILQEATAKNQEFQNTCKSINSFLENLPTDQINSHDDMSQVAYKQSSQERVMEDLKRKGDDMDRMTYLSHDLQNLLNVRLIIAIEKELVNNFAKAQAENTQRQKQMGLNEEKVQMVAQQNVQLQSQQKSASEINGLLKELQNEKERTSHAETDLRTFKDRLYSLNNRKGVERIEEKEVLHYYRDPKLETDLADLQNKLHDEVLRHTTIQTEVDVVNKKITVLEDNLKKTPPKLATREVTEYEKDPQLDLDAVKLRDEIARMRDEIRMKDGEQIHMKTEVSILQKKPNPIKERVVMKEVLKVERDPVMLKAVQTTETELSDENNKMKLLNEVIFQTRSEINALEREIPFIKPKVVVREVKKIEQDPELINESKKIRVSLEEDKIENNSLSKELTGLQSRYKEVQLWKPRIEVKETVNEIYQIDPNTEVEIMRLRKEIQESSKQRSNLERDISQVTSEVNILSSKKPKVELKEVLQEVVKEERSPENEREIQRLNDQVNHLHTTYNSVLDKVRLLRNERDEWKAEKSKIETRLLSREVIKYEPDPLVEKEAERLRRDVREEAQMRRNFEDIVFDLKNKYLLLERQKPEEKLIVQEVVRLQRNPMQVLEHEKLGKNLDEEIKSRRQTELELQQLRTNVEDKERILKESDERQKKIQVESELRDIRLRITQLENAPPPIEENIVVEEVLKVEREPNLDRMTSGLRADMDKHTADILRLERDIRSSTLKLDILQKEKAGEKTVYKEVVRVEKDQAVEAERDRLREQVSQQRFARQDLEDEIRRLNDKINLLTSNKTTSSREETSLILTRDASQRERDDLTRELRKLEAKRHETSLTFQQQSRLMSERTQMSRQRSLKMDSDVHRLEREILDEKDKIHQRDSSIRELLLQLQKEEQAETRTKETNVSTKISILDPETGKDMSPYDAYLQGLIDRQQYIHLQELECDWEEITSVGPDGEIFILQDRKSGRQYSIKDALKDGRLTEYNLQQYKQGKIPISEFALLVAGDNKKEPLFNSVAPKSSTTVKSSPSEVYPVAGIMDTHTDTCFTIRSAAARKLIDNTTALKLLEAQASTGGIIDINSKERHTVHKAANKGLIDDSQLQRLLNAQKAFTGVEDPVTRECLSVGEAVQKGWMPKETAIRYMEAQHLTGGLVDPKTGRRVSIMDAIGCKMINSTMLRELQAETMYIKDITDPITKEKINFKQALDRCKKDPMSGLPMLPASSKNSGYTPLYNSSSRYSRF
uniref:Uncharacterized protein n=1 Tax=Mola mola TaxID=94237 RepID=A0A3Q3WRL3_MOLML